jgi:hypothetical protein
MKNFAASPAGRVLFFVAAASLRNIFRGDARILSFFLPAARRRKFLSADASLQEVFRADSRMFSFFLAAFFLFFFFSARASAQSQLLPRNDSERELFDLLNRERATQNLSALKWDEALFKAARQHALLMLNLNSFEHQLPGEPALSERLAAAGARFSFIAENIAFGKDSNTIHNGWMHSPGHRKNILNPRVTAVGIAAVRGTGGLFAVEDFSQAFANLSQEQQEKQVTALLTAKGWRVSGAPDEARKSCDSNAGMPGVRGWSIVRIDTADLRAFSPEIEKKIRSEQFHNVAVGACRTSEAAGFAQYRIALIFY